MEEHQEQGGVAMQVYIHQLNTLIIINTGNILSVFIRAICMYIDRYNITLLYA